MSQSGHSWQLVQVYLVTSETTCHTLNPLYVTYLIHKQPTIVLTHYLSHIYIIHKPVITLTLYILRI